MKLEEENVGEIFLVGTPIGNLEDISFRALRILKEVDMVAAEDTRQTRKLLNFYEINVPLTSYHEHNKKEKGIKLIEEAKAGKRIALVTDAGMPGISDPGQDLVQLAISNEVKVTPIPGPSASLTALIISGLETEKFVFEGFLPRKKKELQERLEKLFKEERTLILYEAPHRLLKTLQELYKIFGDRKISVTRELTKKFEETIRGTLSEVIKHFEDKGVKGEFTIIVEGNKEANTFDETANDWSKLGIVEHVESLLAEGKDKKEIFKEVAKLRGISKREVYNLFLNK